MYTATITNLDLSRVARLFGDVDHDTVTCVDTDAQGGLSDGNQVVPGLPTAALSRFSDTAQRGDTPRTARIPREHKPRRRRPRVANSPLGVETLREVLTAAEIELLARYVGDGMTAAEIATEQGCPRRTVAHRIQVAVRRLAAAGINVPTPGRGRRKSNPDLVYVGSDKLERMLVSKVPGGRLVSGKWIDSPKVDQPDV